MYTTKQIVNILDRLGIAEPEPLQRHRLLREALDAQRAGYTTAGARLDEILSAGAEPRQACKAFDAAVDATLRQQSADEVARLAEPALVRNGHSALRASTDDLLVKLGAEFDLAAEQLTGAIAVVGAEPNDQEIRRLGPVAARAMGDWQIAVEWLNKVRDVASVLADLQGKTVPLSIEMWVDTTRLDSRQAEQLQYVDTNGIIWCNLIAAGYTLAFGLLGDPAGDLARLAADEAERQRKERFEATRDIREAGRFEVAAHQANIDAEKAERARQDRLIAAAERLGDRGWSEPKPLTPTG